MKGFIIAANFLIYESFVVLFVSLKNYVLMNLKNVFFIGNLLFSFCTNGLVIVSSVRLRV